MTGPKLEITADGVRYLDAEGNTLREYPTPPPHPQNQWGFLGYCGHDEGYHELRAQRDDLLNEVDHMRYLLSQAQTLIAKLMEEADQ